MGKEYFNNGTYKVITEEDDKGELHRFLYHSWSIDCGWEKTEKKYPGGLYRLRMKQEEETSRLK